MRAGRGDACSARRWTSRRSPSDTYLVGGHRRPHHAVGERATGRVHLLGSRPALRALHQRPHRRAGQPAGQPEGDLPRQRRAARGRRGVARGRDADARARWWDGLDGAGSASARAASATPPRRRSGGGGVRAARRERAAGAYVNGGGALRGTGSGEPLLLHHRLRDQLGGLRAGARPLRGALRVHPLRQPRRASARRRDLDAGAGRGRRRACCAARASRARTCTASRWAAWSPRSWRCASPSACAGWCSAEPRRAGRARCARRAAAGRAALARRAGFLARRSGASIPSACASCCATSAAPASARGRTGGRRSTTTRCRGSAQIQAPTLVMHGGRDALSPVDNARLLASRIPDAER